MPGAQLHVAIVDGLRALPSHEAIATLLKLAASLTAGVAILGMGLEIAHPVNRSVDNIKSRIRGHNSGDILEIEEMIDLVEDICHQIWDLSKFQAEPLRGRLRELVEPVSLPPSIFVN